MFRIEEIEDMLNFLGICLVFILFLVAFYFMKDPRRHTPVQRLLMTSFACITLECFVRTSELNPRFGNFSGFKQEVEQKENMLGMMILLLTFLSSVAFVVVFFFFTDKRMLTPVQKVLAVCGACLILVLCIYNLYYGLVSMNRSSLLI
ncbi:hypothetical protein NPIL_158721 [Nephila pilipes]|uniref:Uncharacterized protein n=1 Tax=Nephila pilipes TaxID=299642 RepID=A0A8X6PL80_NEPPI|nr:hypothetical protein NPIL_158721 [Nephila pilipes]